MTVSSKSDGCPEQGLMHSTRKCLNSSVTSLVKHSQQMPPPHSIPSANTIIITPARHPSLTMRPDNCYYTSALTPQLDGYPRKEHTEHYPPQTSILLANKVTYKRRNPSAISNSTTRRQLAGPRDECILRSHTAPAGSTAQRHHRLAKLHETRSVMVLAIKVAYKRPNLSSTSDSTTLRQLARPGERPQI